jgi:glycosyltransferase involved in cell wall biosynthesis
VTEREPSTILFVSVSRGIAGPARSLLTILEHLPSDLRAVLYAPAGSLATAARRDGLVDEVISMPYDEARRRRSRVTAARVLAREVATRADGLLAIHANGQSELNQLSLASLRYRVPIVVIARASEPSPTSGSLRWVWRWRRDRVRWLAVSDTARQVLADTLHLDAGIIHVVPNAVDPTQVVAEPHPHDDVRVAYLGNPFPVKGFDLVGPIIALLDRPGVVFDLFVPKPPANLPLELRPPWDAITAAVAEGRQVVQYGRQPDVRPIYAETDIVLCPSRNESFNRVAVEAMLNGIPVVATDLPAHRALLGDEEAGLLFPVGDAAAGAAAVTRLVNDAALRARLGARGRERAQAYLPERVIPRLVEEYRTAGARR